jgi:hypothetical protein
VSGHRLAKVQVPGWRWNDQFYLPLVTTDQVAQAKIILYLHHRLLSRGIIGDTRTFEL